MRLLLDTHVFLWLLAADERLNSSHLAAIRNPENDVYFSVVSVWEATVKYYSGKLPLPSIPAQYLSVGREKHRIASLHLHESCIRHLPTLPPVHKDPFDRMLICQAIEDGLTLVTDDANIRQYPVPVLSP
ncbi:MAG: type II toxin-antitoxin system VapC family toxin [Verrucomicrobiaceae bacterium]|nr:MAG: type II toxin-antitoxin system VapC family toxin [Verrucomicrobiaceae bacterium]